MKDLKFVAPDYEILQERKTLYTKTVGDGERLDIAAWPLYPSDGTTFPDDIEMAFESVIWNETDLDEEGITDQVMRDWMKHKTLGDLEHPAMEAIRYDFLQNFSGIRGDERTAYICPIISHGGVGYERGYVVAWEESDALDVAEYLAGGRVEIMCGLIDTKEQQAIDSVWLGELSYSDVTCDTDQYRRILEGENIMLALETLEGIEPPACEDPEYPGAESLATFAKME